MQGLVRLAVTMRFYDPKLFSKNLLTQERQCDKIIPVADEAALFERAMKKISKKSFDKPLRMW